MQPQSKYDVVIVGLGPVGLLMANLMGKKGYKVLGIDKVENAYNFPRAIHLDAEIVRIMQSVDLADVLMPKLRPSFGLDLLDKNYQVMAHTSTQFPSPYASNHFMFLQPELEQILKDGCLRFTNVTLQHNVEVTDFKQSNGTIEVFNKGQKIAETTYLIGIDGANSFVRNKLGIGLKDFKFTKAALKIDALEIKPTNEKIDSVQKMCSTSKPWVRMHGVGNHRRWELNYDNGYTKEEIEKEGKAIEMLAEIGVDTSNLEIVHAVLYYFKSVLAKEWQQGNIFLVGDAAHTTPPYVGQGMCSGFRDALNLSWKLDAVIQKKLPESLLKTYQTERYHHTKLQIFKAIAVGYLFTTRLWYVLKVLSKIPVLNKKMLNIAFPNDKLGKGFWGTGKAAGLLFPQIKISENLYSDTLFMNNWALVSINKPMDSTLQEACEQAGLKAITLLNNAEGFDDMKKWADTFNAKYFIIRPDFYVFSAGNDANSMVNEFSKLKKNKKYGIFLSKIQP